MDRTKGIGGSDVAAVMGLSPWKTPGQLWLEKTGRVPGPDLDDKDHIIFGTLLEQTIADEYARRTGRKVRKVNKRLEHPDYPFMVAHIDRDVVGLPRILECKTTNAWSFGSDEWGAAGTDECPTQYVLQAQHYLFVTGAVSGIVTPKVCDLAVLVGGNRFVLYEIQRDDELIEAMVAACSAFWAHVENDEPLPLEYDHRSAMEYVKAKHPGIDGEVQLGEEAAIMHARRQEISEATRALKKEDDALKAHLTDLVGGAEIGYLPGGIGGFRRKLVQRAERVVPASEWIEMRFSKKLTPEVS